MTPLASALLDVDAAALALAQTLGRTERGDAVRQRIGALRVAAHRALLADLAAHPAQIDPAEAVRAVLDSAIAAGLPWAQAAAIFNTASEGRN